MKGPEVGPQLSEAGERLISKCRQQRGDRCPSMGDPHHYTWFGKHIAFQVAFARLLLLPFRLSRSTMPFAHRSLRKTLIPETKRKHTDPLNLVRYPGGPVELGQASFCILRA